jgi:hypothetical protein
MTATTESFSNQLSISEKVKQRFTKKYTNPVVLTLFQKNTRQYAGFNLAALFLLFGGMHDVQAQTYGTHTALVGWNTIASNSCGNTNLPNANMIDTGFANTNVENGLN